MEPLPLMTIPEVARITGWKRSTLYEKAKRGELPGVVRLGGRLRVRREDAERFLGVPPATRPAVEQERPAMAAAEV